MAKIVPAITTLSYIIPNGTSYIDIARDLSRVNRRLYRQGRNYAIESITVTSSVGMKSSDNVAMVFSSMGNSYMVHEAWERGFKAWRKQIRDHSEPGQLGKWNDFKIYLDDSMEDGTTNDVLAGDGAAVSSGEWAYSKLAFDDDGTEREFTMCMIGTSNLADTNEESGIALLEEWADARFYPTETPTIPSTASSTIWAKIKGTDELTDMIMDNIEADNDTAPYHATDYYGGATNGDAPHPERFIACSASEIVTTQPGFIAPCGLIQVRSEELSLDNTQLITDQAGNPSQVPGPGSTFSSGTAPAVAVQIRLVPGPYKGVLAPPMGQ